MTYFIPLRKLVKILSAKRLSTKRDRLPLIVPEGAEKNASESRIHIKLIILIVLLLIIIAHYLHLLLIDIASTKIKEYIYLPRYQTSEDANTLGASYKNGRKEALPLCNINWTSLGKVYVNKTVGMFLPEKEYPIVLNGGYYVPRLCNPRHKVGILVPYRDRQQHLGVFLYNMHPFLMRQNLEYRIFVIEQKGTDAFNRGKLFNVGFQEMKKFGNWNCVVFHDVDLLPLDGKILYTCPTWPRHMCATVAEVTDPSFKTLFGGVSSMTLEAFETVNGYSNLYWGWGGEDNDLFWRIRYSKFPIVRYNKSIARYTSLKHPLTKRNNLRYQLLSETRHRYLKEGLSTLAYQVESVTLHHLYTHILVDINPNNTNITAFINKIES